LARQKIGERFRCQHLADPRTQNQNGVIKKLVWLEISSANPNGACDSSQPSTSSLSGAVLSPAVNNEGSSGQATATYMTKLNPILAIPFHFFV
jgi:hypothetical protein